MPKQEIITATKKTTTEGKVKPATVGLKSATVGLKSASVSQKPATVGQKSTKSLSATKVVTKVAVKATNTKAGTKKATTKLIPATKRAVSNKVKKVTKEADPKKPHINRATLKDFATRLEILEAVKLCIEKKLIPTKPDIGGINKLGKQGLLEYVSPYLVPHIYNIIIDSRRQIAERKLDAKTQELYDIINSHNCKEIIDASKEIEASIPNMYTARKSALILSIIDSGCAQQVIKLLPVRQEGNGEEEEEITQDETNCVEIEEDFDASELEDEDGMEEDRC